MNLQFKIVCDKDLDIQGDLVLLFNKLVLKSEPFRVYSFYFRGSNLGLTFQDHMGIIGLERSEEKVMSEDSQALQFQ